MNCIVRKTFFKILLSACVSLILVLLLYRLSGGGAGLSGAVSVAVGEASVLLVGSYFVCQICQASLRAVRSRVLIGCALRRRSDSVALPSFWDMLQVTLVRGACADMLPARLGEASYVAMLNGGWRIPGGDCLSSLSVGIFFDVAALLAVLFAAVAFGGGLSLAGATAVLFIVCLTGYVLLFRGVSSAYSLASRCFPARFMNFRPYAWGMGLLRDTAESISAISESKTSFLVLMLSVAIRFVKYAGMIVLFRAVSAAAWPEMLGTGVSHVLIALISAEGAASLPVPSFMSFGTYEAGGTLALTALGFGMSESVGVLLAMHIASQVIDYSLGVSGFVFFIWEKRGREAKMGGGIRTFLTILTAAVLSAAAMWPIRSRCRSVNPEQKNTGIGAPVEPGADFSPPAGFRGRIVWSSNKSGSHDIYMMTLPSGRTERLTNSDHADTYPRFSPDGRRIAFSRSRPKWVSHRDQRQWDVWTLDLETGEEKLVAANAFSAVWTPDGKSLVYVKNADSLAQCPADNPEGEKIILTGPMCGLPEGTIFQTPNVDGTGRFLAVTIRRRGVWVFDLQDVSLGKNIDGGCEITWWNGAETPRIVWVNHPGKQKNTFFTAEGPEYGKKRLLDIAGDYSHEYFPKVSADGKWLVYGASTGGHEHDVEDYEIFLWRIGTEEDSIFRVTWHTSNDNWPDVFADGGSAEL